MKKLLLTLLITPLLANSEFGWNLFEEAAQSNKNTLISPYSIHSCLAMTATGARGETLSEMEKVLVPSFVPIKSDNLKVVNSLWVAPQFYILPSFTQTVEKEFQASIQSLDFQNPQKAADTINGWTADHTDQKIKNLIAPTDLEKSTRLVLTNALYFSGKFARPFNPKATTEQPFWIDAETSIEKPTMELTSSIFYAEDAHFQTIALPFEGSQIALVIALPKEKTFTKIAGEKFQFPIDQLQFERVHLKLPKFTLKERLNLNQILTSMGLSLAFTPQADFSGIDGKHDLYLSKVLHEAYFAVDENGVVAAAATAAAINVTSFLPTEPPIEFNADHPFIFALIDFETKTPLFLGELFNP